MQTRVVYLIDQSESHSWLWLNTIREVEITMSLQVVPAFDADQEPYRHPTEAMTRKQPKDLHSATRSQPTKILGRLHFDVY
jgi:hypothetical protein